LRIACVVTCVERTQRGGHAPAWSLLNHRFDVAHSRDRPPRGFMTMPNGNGRCRIALTGGPGGGKTTAADLYRREIGPQVVVVPEAATMLFSGGFPRSSEIHARKAAQLAIFHVQKRLEDVQSALYPDRILLCDRGTIDGAAFWPGGAAEFFELVGTTIEKELARYDAVLFFESAAAGGISIEGGNPIRIESNEQALELDRKLREIWLAHPRTVVIPHDRSFLKKIMLGLASLENIVADLAAAHRSVDASVDAVAVSEPERIRAV
jgi:predicted ATPase